MTSSTERSGAGEPALSAESIQELLARAVSAYSAAVEDDPTLSPLPNGHEVTETDALRCICALLDSFEIEMFELAMWRLWSSSNRSGR
jgi:hypothetical protein